jgi:hypothetical protein
MECAVDEKERLFRIQEAIIGLAGAFVATRASLAIVARQPSLILSQTDRQELMRTFEDGGRRLDKVFALIEKILEDLEKKDE